MFVKRCLTVVLLCSFSLDASADDVVKELQAIRQRQRDTELQSLKMAREEANQLHAKLVSEGEDRPDLVKYRDELKARIAMIEGNLDSNFEEEFEAVDDRGGWWWLDGAKRDQPNPKTTWYRLDRSKKLFKHYYKDAAGKTQWHAGNSSKYRVIGLDPDNSDILKVKVTNNEGIHGDLRFNRKTKEIEGDSSWYGIPK